MFYKWFTKAEHPLRGGCVAQKNVRRIYLKKKNLNELAQFTLLKFLSQCLGYISF